MTKSASPKGPDNPITALSGPSLALILAALGTSTAAVTLPELSRDFQEARLDATLVVSIYLLATTALIVPVGRAGDLLGKRTVLVGGLCLYILGAILAFFAPTLPILIASRFVQGAGAAAMMAMPLALVRDFAAAGRVGRWMGAMGTMSAIGTASGPVLGGLVVATFGWRSVYLVQIPIALAALATCMICLKSNRPRNKHTRIDLPGATALAVALTAFTLLVSEINSGFGAVTALLALVTVIAFLAFLLIESRTKAPIIPLDVLRSAYLRLSLTMNAIISLIMMGILVVGPFYLTAGLGLTTAQMGLAMSVGPVSSALTGVPAGRLTEKVGAGQTVCFGAIALTIATAAMAGLPYVFGLGGFIVAFMLLAPSYQVFLAALNTSVMENVPEHDRGVTSGVLNLSRNFGFILGASSVSAVFWSLARITAGTGLDDHAIRIAMAGTFAACCVLTICVLLLALLLNSARFQHHLRKDTAAYES